jgi:hypothetical protein
MANVRAPTSLPIRNQKSLLMDSLILAHRLQNEILHLYLPKEDAFILKGSKPDKLKNLLGLSFVSKAFLQVESC